MTQPRHQAANSERERLATIEAKVDVALSDVGRLATAVDKLAGAVSGVTATAQVLASADAALTARVTTLETQFQAYNDKRLELIRDQDARFALIQTSQQQLRGDLQTQINAAVTSALRESRDSERRVDDRDFSKHSTTQNNQLAIILAIVGISASLLMMILNLVK